MAFESRQVSYYSSGMGDDSEYIYDSREATYVAEEEYYEGFAYQESEVILEQDEKELKKREIAGTMGEVNPLTVASKNAFLPPEDEIRAVTTYCDEMQMEAVRLLVAKSKNNSVKSYAQVLKKAERLGYTEDQLTTALLYIRDVAPLIIQVKLDQNDRLKKMTADTHYRNQFEVQMSNGSISSDHSNRVSWEDRLFDKVYHKAKPFQRPKYGVLNMVNDPVGIKRAHQYGDSHFVCKRVRLRVSFADQDTGSSSAILASCEHYCHVLERYNDNELKSVIQVANGEVPFADSDCIQSYKEVQYHGELSFQHNVERVVVNDRHKGDKSMSKTLDLFCEKNGCDWLYCSDLKKEIEANAKVKK